MDLALIVLMSFGAKLLALVKKRNTLGLKYLKQADLLYKPTNILTIIQYFKAFIGYVFSSGSTKKE
jgi:hypothetical protein